MDDENLDELIDQHSSPSDIKAALREKQAGELDEQESIGEKIKHYPRPKRELDLHGKTADEARREIKRFIYDAQKNRIRTVRIITGKGLHSPNQKSVLPEIAEQTVAELKSEDKVLSFKREKTGGSLIVYLT